MEEARLKEIEAGMSCSNHEELWDDIRELIAEVRRLKKDRKPSGLITFPDGRIYHELPPDVRLTDASPKPIEPYINVAGKWVGEPPENPVKSADCRSSLEAAEDVYIAEQAAKGSKPIDRLE